MSHYYLDSSALVKRYMRETGSHWIRAITNPDAEHVIIVARITAVEIMSAVSRLRRENSISMGIVEAVQLILNRHMRREYVVIELTDAVTRQAINLLSAYPLRAYDSVQLASALESNARLTVAGLSSLIFVSADQRLLAAASGAGLTTVDPHAQS